MVNRQGYASTQQMDQQLQHHMQQQQQQQHLMQLQQQQTTQPQLHNHQQLQQQEQLSDQLLLQQHSIQQDQHDLQMDALIPSLGLEFNVGDISDYCSVPGMNWNNINPKDHLRSVYWNFYIKINF